MFVLILVASTYTPLRVHVESKVKSTEFIFKCKKCVQSPEASADVVIVDAFRPFTSSTYSVGFFWESPQHYAIKAKTNITWSFRPDSTITSYAMIANKPLPSAIPFKAKKPVIATFISNCNIDRSGRMKLLKEIMKHFTVHSYGRCLKNMALTGSRDKKVETFSKYMFAFVPENSICAYYHSEKLYDAFTARTVPIYLGAKTILEQPYSVDPESFIWGDRPDLIPLLKMLASNETAYNRYLQRQKMFSRDAPSACFRCKQLRHSFIREKNEAPLSC